MNVFQNLDTNKPGIRKFWQNLYLFACFLPISIGGVTANYLFAGLLLSGRYRRGDQVHFLVPLFAFFCVFSYAWTFSFMTPTEGLMRQTFSFSVFSLGLCLLFVRLPYQLEDIMKVILLATTLYTLWVIYTMIQNPLFAISNPNGVKVGMREYVTDWPQRYIILVGFASFYALHKASQNKAYFIIFLLHIACVFISFTRSAYLSLILGMCAYAALVLGSKGNAIRLKPKNLLYSMAAIFLLVGVVLTNEDIQFAGQLLISRTVEPISQFLTGQEVGDNSAATRLDYWATTLDVVSRSPIIGTGFGGISLYDSHVGSAHNQYLDLLLRTGLVGVTCYIFLWLYLLRAFMWTRPYIFAGLLSVFAYGFFHETTKLTYCALLFFILLNFVFEEKYAQQPQEQESS